MLRDWGEARAFCGVVGRRRELFCSGFVRLFVMVCGRYQGRSGGWGGGGVLRRATTGGGGISEKKITVPDGPCWRAPGVFRGGKIEIFLRNKKRNLKLDFSSVLVLIFEFYYGK